MNDIAFRALPFSILESQSVIDISADMAPLAGGKESVNLVDLTTIPLPFVLEHVDKLIPSGVRDRFSKVVISDHVSNSEVFNMYCLVIADKLFACLMKKITALIRNFLMLHGKYMNCFTSGVRVFFLPSYRALKSFKPPLSLAKVFGTFHHFAVRNSEECLNTEVNTYFTTNTFWLRYLNFAKDGGVIFTRSTAGDGNGLHCSFYRSVEFYLDSLRSWDVKFVIQRPSLGNRKRLCISTFLKPRKFSSVLKEVIVGNVKMSETLLQGLGVYFAKPAIFLLLFELGEHGRCIVIAQSLLDIPFVFRIPINALAKEVVIHKTGTSEVLLKKLSLLAIGIYSVFVGFINFHITKYTTLV